MWFLFACVLPIDTYDSKPVDWTCDEVAIPDATGAPDPCDVAACENCIDNCGADGCMILESYPPQYACDQGGTWDVTDVCPNWSMPSTPYAVDEVSLGCADGTQVETLTATATTPGRVDVSHVDAVTGCCPQALAVAVVANEGVLHVAYDLVSDLCECACLIDVTYSLVEVPSGTWTLIAGENGMSSTVVVP